MLLSNFYTILALLSCFCRSLSAYGYDYSYSYRYGRTTTTTQRPEPITLSPEATADVLRTERSFRRYQRNRYLMNPQWFKQLGRPCDPDRSVFDFFITKVTKGQM